jgi:Zn finger protein HypA/HybF involved in hydrogenase expression
MTLQPNWRWCNKCEGLFFPQPNQGNCPAGGTHNSVGSNNYTLVFDSPPAVNQQDNWRYCSKCQGLYFAGHGTQGVCPATGTHEHSLSQNYTLAHDLPLAPGQQPGWSWCHKCQGLFYTGNSSGVCKAGGGHAGSGNYRLAFA